MRVVVLPRHALALPHHSLTFYPCVDSNERILRKVSLGSLLKKAGASKPQCCVCAAEAARTQIWVTLFEVALAGLSWDALRLTRRKQGNEETLKSCSHNKLASFTLRLAHQA